VNSVRALPVAKEVPVRLDRSLLLASLALSVLALPAADAAAAEVQRTLEARLAGPDLDRFGVENLAGAMRVTGGSGMRSRWSPRFTPRRRTSRTRCGSSASWTRTAGPPCAVRYPLDQHTTFRYPQGGEDGGGGGIFGLFGGSGSETRYDGRRVRVSASRGLLLYADLEVRVPARVAKARFKNHIGPMTGHGVHGSILFDTGGGAVKLSAVGGDVVADTGSGDVAASELDGSFKCDTGSGDCEISGFHGDRLVCDTGSGSIRVESAIARRIAVDSGSGDVHLLDTDAEELEMDTGSGSLALESAGRRLSRVKADTGSGNVTLRLPRDSGFEVVADLGSGNIVNRYADAEPVVRQRELVGYRRGDGRIRIAVDTGSGNLVLEPH
jgi:hypothetical protein